MLTPDVRRSQ